MQASVAGESRGDFTSSVYQEPSAITYSSHYPWPGKMHIFSWQSSFEAQTEPLSWYLHCEVFRNQLMALF